MPTPIEDQKLQGHKICFISTMMKVVNLETFRLKKAGKVAAPKKDQTWLYSISYDELFSEFIETFNRFEKDPQCGRIHEWLDQVSDALNERFYNRKTEDVN